MFLGQYDHALDKKGRLVMPAKFREAFEEHYAEHFVLMRWFEECLRLFPLAEWEAFRKKLAALPQTNPNARLMLRALLSTATDVGLDKQGRVFIPPPLRALAGIDRHVVIVGIDHHIEIWDKHKWQAYSKDAGQALEQVSQQLVNLGV